MNALEVQFGADRIAFSPSMVILGAHQARTVHVKLSDAMEADSELKIEFTTTTPNVVVSPSVLSWKAAAWREIKTFTVQEVNGTLVDASNVVTMSRVSSSTLYNQATPSFQVDYKA